MSFRDRGNDAGLSIRCAEGYLFMENFSIIFEKAMKAEPIRKKKIITRDMRAQYPIDGIAKSVLENIEGRVSDKLYQDMMDYLLGFNEDMQLEIADNLLDAVCYGWEHYIGIPHIDTNMMDFYLSIEEEIKNQSN